MNSSESKVIKGVRLSKPLKPKKTSICDWCKKEKIGRAGKYHKWCSDVVRRERVRDYQKAYYHRKND